MADPRLPVLLVSGPLGSGKTRLINTMLDTPSGARTLLIQCQLGRTTSLHPLSVHAVTTGRNRSGLRHRCACCVSPRDLLATLRESHWRFSREGQSQFDQVIIELDAQADVNRLRHDLTHEPALASRYRLDRVLTLPADGPACPATGPDHPVSQK